MMSRKTLLGLAVGAAVAYFASPQAGTRRRAQAKDQFMRAGQKARDAFAATRRNLADRTSGMMASTTPRSWSANTYEASSR
jgi:hypothetical protein